MMNTDLMIDLETMGNRSYAAIVSVGMVAFDINTGEIGEKLYIEIDLESCLRAKLRIDSSTLMWWLKQNDVARSKITDGSKTHLKPALEMVTDFVRQGKYTRVWGNGSRFDLGILENAYQVFGELVPWAFWQEMDLRTLVAFAPDVKKNTLFEGIAHSPIDDCLHQIKYATEIWRRLNK